MGTLEELGLDDEIGCELELLDMEKAEEQRVEMVVLQAQVDMDAKRAVEATEESEESDGWKTGRDNEEEEEVSDSMV